MEIQEENRIIRAIYEEALLQEKKISDVLGWIRDEELNDELNQLLVAWRQFGRKARRRLQENISGEDGSEELSVGINRKDLRMKPDIDEYVIRPASENADAGDWRSDDAIAREEIMRTEQMAERMKYMIHENKRAGIFATELARELIDFEQSSIRKLKNYLQ